MPEIIALSAAAPLTVSALASLAREADEKIRRMGLNSDDVQIVLSDGFGGFVEITIVKIVITEDADKAELGVFIGDASGKPVSLSELAF